MVTRAAAAKPSLSASAWVNIRAARIGPTVCELDGPIPTLNKSKTLTATQNSALEKDAGSSIGPRESMSAFLQKRCHEGNASFACDMDHRRRFGRGSGAR